MTMFNKSESDNKAIKGTDVLVNEKNELNAELQRLQRKKELELDIINKKYENKIDKILRALQLNKMKMEQAKAYAKENLIGA